MTCLKKWKARFARYCIPILFQWESEWLEELVRILQKNASDWSTNLPPSPKDSMPSCSGPLSSKQKFGILRQGRAWSWTTRTP